MCIGNGESFVKAAIKREPIASPEASPATKNILISPSLEAKSTADCLEVEKYFPNDDRKYEVVLLFELWIGLSNIVMFTANQKSDQPR